MKKINVNYSKLKVKSTKNCDLIFYEDLKKKIRIKRLFFLKSKKKCLRGDHAHKKCSQYFFSIKGNIKIYVNDGRNIKIIKIKELDKVLYVPPYTWVKVFLEKKQILCVMCDRNYEASDYINSYSKFTKIINKIN
jgi:dTDP-4-dehydrorhamnose 3,5-epimerase-like enzyme